MKGSLLFLVLITSLALGACTNGISRQTRSQVTYFGTFDQLQQQPDQHKGETVILGGKIIETQVADGVTEMMVLQLELNRWDQPQDDDRSQGRFVVRTAQFLDPAVYPQGTLITVVGRLQGSQVKPIGQMAYRYPIIEMTEIKKWPPKTQSSPRFHFGIGVGTHF